MLLAATPASTPPYVRACPGQVLHSATLAAVRVTMKAKRHELLAAMRAMPDYSMNLSWRLGSSVPGLGMLLRRYAPADTYTLWKVRGGARAGERSSGGYDTAAVCREGCAGPQGCPTTQRHTAGLCQARMHKRGPHTPLACIVQRNPMHRRLVCMHACVCSHTHASTHADTRSCHARARRHQVGDRLRVDGTLMGIDTKAASLIPEWKRGHFSLVMDGSASATGASGSGGPAAPAEAPAPAAAAGEAGGAAASRGASSAGASTSGGGAAPRLLFLHHGKQRWVDLGADKKAMKGEEQAALEDHLLAALERWVGGRGLRGGGAGRLRHEAGAWQ